MNDKVDALVVISYPTMLTQDQSEEAKRRAEETLQLGPNVRVIVLSAGASLDVIPLRGRPILTTDARP